MKLLIVGAGRVGCAIGLTLKQQGWDVEWAVRQHCPCHACLNLNALSGKWDVILLTVSDDAISDVAISLKSKGIINSDTFVGHTSGSLSSEILPPAKARFSMHPPFAFPQPALNYTLPEGLLFAIEGDQAGMDVAKRIVNTLKGQAIFIEPRAKTLYHAACVIASNFTFLNAMMAHRAFLDAGIQDPTPFIRVLVDSAIGLSPSWSSTTGPVAREDIKTLEKHIKAIKNLKDPELLNFYRVTTMLLAENLFNNGVITEETWRKIKALIHG